MRTTIYTLLIVGLGLFGPWDAQAQTDCPPLTPFCQDLNTSYMPGACMVEVWAKDFINKIYDDATSLDSFFISFNPDVLEMSKIFMSEDGKEQTVLIYIRDACGNTTICEVDLDINDNTGECPETCPVDPSPWCGYAVVTCSAFESDNYTAAIIDTRKNSLAPRGANWTDPLDSIANKVGFIRPNTWQLGDIGQVFGTALSPVDGSIFFAASDVYALDFKIYAEAIDPVFLRGDTPPTCPGPGGAAAIYKTSFIDQSITTLVSTSTVYLNSVAAIGGTQIPNSGNDVQCASTSIEGRSPIGNGIGNIAYDERSNHLFASNLEDGKIYSINATTGVIDFILDPWDEYETHASDGMVRTLDRIWAVQIRSCGAAKKLFFSRSSLEEAGIKDRDKEIYSVFIGGNGNFIGSEQLEFTVPFGRQAKITDIAFSADCNKVLVSERGHPHKAQVHEYVLNNGIWEHNQQFFVGIFSPNDLNHPDGNILGSSSSGGVSYGPKEENCVIDAACDDLVWATINCGSPGARDASRCSIYGAQGIDASGNILETSANTDIYISFSEDVATPIDFKTSIGDIDIYNCCCPAEPGRDVQTSARITGQVVSAFKNKVKNTEISIESSDRDVKIMSGEDGKYVFENAIVHRDYMIQAKKDGDVLDGLTTRDLIEIQRHILGLRKLDSPYKQIAADINNSGNITAQDLIELRKILIGKKNSFDNNNVWNLVGTAQEQLAIDPFSYDSYIEVFDLPEPMQHADFTAVKTGDINGDNTVDRGSGIRSNERIDFRAEITNEKNKTTVRFYIDQRAWISGFQMSIQADETLNDVISGQVALSSDMINIVDGEIRISWNINSVIEFDIDKPLFALQYDESNTIVSLGKSLDPQVYSNELYVRSIKLNKSISSTFEGINVSPNPTKGIATLKFHSIENHDAQIIVNSVDGRKLYQRNIQVTKGINELALDTDDMQMKYSGLSVVQIITPYKTINAKLLIVK
ncbi:MAG: hypothetical protein ACJA01_003452 [Saprospiraceae bacterium]|jgi:hypothetical protein